MLEGRTPLLLLLLLLPLATGQLASFEDLRRSWLGSLETQNTIKAQGQEAREDRSLTGTYPFNHVASQDSHQPPAPQPQAIFQHQGGLPRQVASQRQSLHQQAAPQQAQFQQQAHHLAQQQGHHPTQQQGHHPAQQQGHHPAQQQLPASAQQLGQAQAQASFSLLAGFGSRAQPPAQYQTGAPSRGQGPYRTDPVRVPVPSLARATFGTAPAYGPQAYNSPAYGQAYSSPAYGQAYSEAYSSPAQFLNFATAPSACPVTAGLPLSQCQGAGSSCWSVGQTDVDCPQHGLCCFDGCANTCHKVHAPGPFPAPAPLPAPLPAPAPFLPPAPLPPAPILARRVPPRNPFQARQPSTGTSFRDVAAAPQKCIDKIETVEEIEYEEVEQCDHSYDRQCHTSYVTEYESQQEEECEDNYKKSCDITYSPQAQNVTVQICMRPLVKDCNLAGPEVCRTEYISECWTRNDPHLVEEDVPHCQTVQEERCVETVSGYSTQEDCKKWPREVCTISRERKAKFNPVTKCEKVPQQLCGPSGCGFVQGPEICHEEVKTVVTDIPEEVCDLQPQRSCSHVTKLVPKLSPVEECVDVPKEVCTKAKANPRTVQRPVTKRWCYTPSEESGLA